MDIAAVLRNSSGEVSQYLQGRPCTPLSWESKTNTTTSEDSAWGYTADRLVRELRLNPKAQEYVFIKHAIKNHAVSSVSPLGLQYGRSACLLAFNSITASFSFLLHLPTEKTIRRKLILMAWLVDSFFMASWPSASAYLIAEGSHCCYLGLFGNFGASDAPRNLPLGKHIKLILISCTHQGWSAKKYCEKVQEKKKKVLIQCNVIYCESLNPPGGKRNNSVTNQEAQAEKKTTTNHTIIFVTTLKI